MLHVANENSQWQTDRIHSIGKMYNVNTYKPLELKDSIKTKLF